MAEFEELTLSTLLGLLNLRSVYLLGYAWLFGMSFWVTFFGGVIAFKALPRQQFGALQHRTFPVYFWVTILLGSGLLGLWTYGHPGVVGFALVPRIADVAQAYVLVSIVLAQTTNQFIIGPLVNKTMFRRWKQEKDEGKQATDPGVSAEMKALNSKFAKLHGISSLANLHAVIALLFHGLWIANKGLGSL